MNELEYYLSNDIISQNVISMTVSKSSYKHRVQVSCGVIFSKTKVNCTKKGKKGITLKVLVLHRSCGLSFASRKKASHSAATVSPAIYLTFCNKCATRLRIS